MECLCQHEAITTSAWTVALVYKSQDLFLRKKKSHPHSHISSVMLYRLSYQGSWEHVGGKERYIQVLVLYVWLTDLQVTSSLMEPAGRRSDTLLKVKGKAFDHSTIITNFVLMWINVTLHFYVHAISTPMDLKSTCTHVHNMCMYMHVHVQGMCNNLMHRHIVDTPKHKSICRKSTHTAHVCYAFIPKWLQYKHSIRLG